MNLELKTVSVMVLPSVYTVARGSDGPSKEGSSKSCERMILSLRLRLLFVSGTFRRNFFFLSCRKSVLSFTPENYSPKPAVCSTSGPTAAFDKCFLVSIRKCWNCGVAYLAYLSLSQSSASIFKFPVSNSVDFVCQSGKHRSEYYIHNQNSVPCQNNYRR